MMQRKSLWSFGTREVVFAAIGAALYAVLTIATAGIQIPGAANVNFRPAVAIIYFFGLVFGPIVGFITGALGNTLADLLAGFGFWPWWGLGNGLMGFVAGLFAPYMTNYRALRDLIIAEVAVVLSTAVGMFVASLSEMWVSGADWATVIGVNFVPAFVSNIINGLVLVPLLLLAYSAVAARSGRGQAGASSWEAPR
jgi:energy-coupling factor transport system substrate-specific component